MSLLNFSFQVLSLFSIPLVVSLCLAGVCPDLHSSLFHGGSACTHSHGPCESHGDSDENDDSQSCPVVLYGQGLETPEFFTAPVFLGTFCFETHPLCVDLQWPSRKHDSFGARDPPVSS